MKYQALFETYKRILSDHNSDKSRYLFDKINWKNRLIVITGQRGMGKTTLMLQRIKEISEIECLYISADSLFIYRVSLYDIALDFRNNGGKYLFIDEVHKYADWSGEIKHIYDTIPDLNLIITGSSILDILKGYGDLSRRAVHYVLHGMSFREFLYFETGQQFPVFSLDEIVTGSMKIPLDKPLMHFRSYLKKGYYPFYQEHDFELRLLNVVNTVLEVDLVQYLELRPATIAKLKKLMQIIAESVPFKPNISKIAELTDIPRNLLPDYLHYLERAGLIMQVQSSTKGIRGLGKAEKIYLNNTNLAQVLVFQSEANQGNIRETAFASQIRIIKDISIPGKGDFYDGLNTYEIGGRDKNGKQIAHVQNGFVVKDDIEYAFSNQIPLWHFGFLY